MTVNVREYCQENTRIIGSRDHDTFASLETTTLLQKQKSENIKHHINTVDADDSLGLISQAIVMKPKIKVIKLIWQNICRSGKK